MQGFSGNIYDGFHESREKDKTQNQYSQKGFPQYTKGKKIANGHTNYQEVSQEKNQYTYPGKQFLPSSVGLFLLQGPV